MGDLRWITWVLLLAILSLQLIIINKLDEHDAKSTFSIKVEDTDMIDEP